MGIADSMKGITENIVASYDVRVKALKDLVVDTRKTIKGFAADRKEMSEEQAKNLADFVNALTKNVGTMLKGFQTSHKEMSETLSESLEKGETDRLKDFKAMMGNIQKGIKDIEAYVAKKLKEFDKAHADMSVELKKELAKYANDMVEATKKLISDIQKRQIERNAEVADLLEAFKAEREKMAANWQALTAKMAKRRGIKPKVEAEVKVRPVEEVVEEEEVTAEPGMEERVLEFIESRSEGVRVSDMEESLGVARTRLGKTAKRLLDEGKVRKEENLYFPL